MGWQDDPIVGGTTPWEKDPEVGASAPEHFTGINERLANAWNAVAPKSLQTHPGPAPEPGSLKATLGNIAAGIPKAEIHAVNQAANFLGHTLLPGVSKWLPSDEEVQKESQQIHQDPNYSAVGNFIGSVGPAMAIPGGASLPGLALSGAAQGGVLSDPGERLKNAAMGAAANVVLPKALSYVSDRLGEGAHILANKFLSKGARQKELSEAATKAAYESGGIRPFTSAKAAYNRMADSLNELQQKEYGPMMERFEKAGVEGMSPARLEQELRGGGLATAKGTTVKPFYEPYFNEAEQIGAVNPATHAFEANPYREPLPSGNYSLSQGESIKQGLQHQAKQAYKAAPGLPVAGSGVAYEDMAAAARRLQEEAVAAQAAKAPEEAASFIPLKQKYGALAEAKAAAAMAATREANRGVWGLPESMAIGGLASVANPADIPKHLGRMIATRMLRERVVPAAGVGAYRLGQLAETAAESPTTARLLIQAMKARYGNSEENKTNAP